MPKYMIERSVPETMTEEQLTKAAQASLEVLKRMGGTVQWLHSYITKGKIYSVYIAASEDEIRMHAHHAGLSCNTIRSVMKVIDPSQYE